MAIGDLGMTKIDGPWGRAIELAQILNGDGDAHIDHVYVDMGDGTIVEAMPGGSVRVKQHHDPAHTYLLKCPQGLGSSVACQASKLIGIPYSAADYFALAAHRLHLPAPGLRDYIMDGGHMICSQLGDMAADLGGWHIFKDGRWPGYVTPMALWDMRYVWGFERLAP